MSDEAVLKPSVAVISCTQQPPQHIIQLILNKPELPEHKTYEDEIKSYPWNIENKYYTADINLLSLVNKTLSNEDLSDSIEAAIINFDSTQLNGLEVAERWMPFLDVFNPEVKILVCENCCETSAVTKLQAQKWCIGKGFELVELNPIIEVEDENDCEDDFPETTGVSRIVQALHAHVWPNLIMKPSNSIDNPKVNGVQTKNKTAPEPDTQGTLSMQSLEASLEELLEGEDDFSDLFSKLHDMKARVSECSNDDRKAAAEQVVKAFWKALGGDEDEINDDS